MAYSARWPIPPGDIRAHFIIGAAAQRAHPIVCAYIEEHGDKNKDASDSPVRNVRSDSWSLKRDADWKNVAFAGEAHLVHDHM